MPSPITTADMAALPTHFDIESAFIGGLSFVGYMFSALNLDYPHKTEPLAISPLSPNITTNRQTNPRSKHKRQW